MRVADMYSKAAELATTTTKPSGSASSNKAATTSTAGAAATPAVTVEVSERARELAAKSAHKVDEAKVARLKAALHAGSLKVDAKKIADKIVDGD